LSFAFPGFGGVVNLVLPVSPPGHVSSIANFVPRKEAPENRTSVRGCVRVRQIRRHDFAAWFRAVFGLSSFTMAIARRLCVFCGSSSRGAPVYRHEAIRLGRLLAENGIGLVFGGGRIGLMGAMADAALEAGGEVIGVIPGHLHDREIGHEGVTRLYVVGGMHERKQKMAELADAFAILPGGFGTLEEALEAITWKQLGLHDKPIFLVDVEGYWAPLIGLFDHIVAEKFAERAARSLYRVLERVDDIPPALAAAPTPHPADTSRI
jgi:uncharacterized protein (TIGR00730 family)